MNYLFIFIRFLLTPFFFVMWLMYCFNSKKIVKGYYREWLLGGGDKHMANLNVLAKEITLSEGLKKSVNIAQVKEVMRLVFKALKKMTFAEVMSILSKYK